MFEQFPKQRSELPAEYQALYAAHYKTNRQGGSPAASLSQRLESWLHRQVAADLDGTNTGDNSTLEIGAGTLNQLDYELQVQDYDIVEPFAELYRDAPQLRRIRNICADIRAVEAEKPYARITSVATFEHILNLPEVVAHSGLLLKPDGVLRVAIPSEGTLLWTLGWKLTTGLEFKLKHGLDYGLLMAHEHVNTAQEIAQVLSYFFTNIERRVLGLCPALSLYQFFACRSPRRDLCKAYIERVQGA